ncbi:MAG: hypothetical protein AAF558_07500 [Verrucomicrobiota bacterium]
MATQPVEAEKASKRSLTESSDKIADLMLQISRLEESLALANTEADYFHEKWLKLRLKMEALGIQALTANEKDLEEKAVRLLGDLYRNEKKRLALERAVLDWMDAGKQLKSAGPLQRAQKQAEYEASRRTVLELIEGKEVGLNVARSLNEGRVTLFDEKHQVAILNFGKAQGAIEGTPFRILDENQVIGRCRIIEVREYLSAALVEDLIEGKNVEPGNRLLLDTLK